MANNTSDFTKANGYLIDEFDELQDLRWSDLSTLDEYRELKMRQNDGEVIDETRLAELETTFGNKIVTSARWNKFQDALVNMQTFIKTEVDGYIQIKQNEFQNYIDRFTFRGDWSSSIEYYKRNFVDYQGEIFLAVVDSLGSIPSVSNPDWEIITIKGTKGERGADGFNLTYKGTWEETATYNQADAVRYGNVLFISTMANNIGNQPDPATNTAAWDRLLYSSIITTKLRGQRTLSFESSEIGFKVGDITVFNQDTDELEVFVNSTALEQGVDYTINIEGTTIQKISGTWAAGSIFYFRVTRNQVSELIYSDGQSIQNETISRDKLQASAKITISNTPPVAPVHHQMWIDTSGA